MSGASNSIAWLKDSGARLEGRKDGTIRNAENMWIKLQPKISPPADVSMGDEAGASTFGSPLYCGVHPPMPPPREESGEDRREAAAAGEDRMMGGCLAMGAGDDGAGTAAPAPKGLERGEGPGRERGGAAVVLTVDEGAVLGVGGALADEDEGAVVPTGGVHMPAAAARDAAWPERRACCAAAAA